MSEAVYFRCMMPDADGLPSVGRSARKLGVRVPVDIEPDPEGFVKPAIGGMSVAVGSMWRLPPIRRPRGMPGSTGPRGDHVFRIRHAAVGITPLSVRLDPARPDEHAFVEPSARCRLDVYETAVTRTRPSWERVWP